jgi:hypothetical protein
MFAVGESNNNHVYICILSEGGVKGTKYKDKQSYVTSIETGA